MTANDRPRRVRFSRREARGATEFLSDVATILELSDAARADLVEAYFINVGEITTSDDGAFDVVFDRLRRAGLRWLDVYQAFRALQWLSLEIAERGDGELVQMLDGRRGDDASNDERSSAIEALMTALRRGRTTDEMKVLAAREATRSGVLPAFKNLDATEELRAVFVGEGTPRLVGLEPVASLRIELDSGRARTFAFQATLDDLNELIAKLERIKENLELLDELARAREVVTHDADDEAV